MSLPQVTQVIDRVFLVFGVVGFGVTAGAAVQYLRWRRQDRFERQREERREEVLKRLVH